MTFFSRPAFRIVIVAAVVASSSVPVHTDSRIKTPFELVPLWSDEMLDYLTGVKQRACSGADAAKCARLDAGVCDGTTYFQFMSQANVGRHAPPRVRTKQSGSATPQYFQLELRDAGYSFGSNLYDVHASRFEQIEMVFDCLPATGSACPSGRFQTGRVDLIELSRLGGEDKTDVTRDAEVRPDGPIVVPVDQRVKQFLFSDQNAIYQVHAVAECFSVAPSPIEWTLPVYESRSADAKPIGAIIARVIGARGMDFRYRPATGPDVPFTPDWAMEDWGYMFMMDQTVLDRNGDWFQLPPRPFPRAVWIQLPGRRPAGVWNAAEVYTLSKSLKARRKGASGTTVFAAGTNIVVVGVQGHVLEIRKEEPFDMACSTEEPNAAARPALPTYLVDAPEFYDRDLHLQLTVAYPKGC